MGYCTPIWISDFTYKALFDRIKSYDHLPGGVLVWPQPNRATTGITVHRAGRVTKLSRAAASW